MMMKALRAAVALLLLASPVGAQTVGQLPSGFVLGNSGASRAPGAPASISAMLDRALGSTQGMVLYRGASAWAALATGTAGLALRTGGAAADPSYGILALSAGGTNANLTASNGGIFYSTASASAILAGTATARQMLQSGASTTPAWSTTTWPATTTINRILYSSSASVIGEIATANSGVLVTSGGGVPSISTTMPSALAIPSPALSGTVTGNNTIPLAILAQVATNTVLGNSTSGTANVTALAVGSCSTAASALIWTTNTGFGCNTSITAAAMPASGLTGQVALTAGGTAASLTASNGGVVYSTASAFAVLAGTVTANQCLLSGSSSAPSWGSCAGGAAVASVTANNSSLTISPTTGSVLAEVNLANVFAWTAAHSIASSSATAFRVGLGTTNPALLVDASTASSATGIKIKSAAAAGGVAVSVITSGTNENLTIDAAGSGTITVGGTSTGAITLTRATTMSAALTYGGVTLSNAVTGTGNMVLATSPSLTTPTLGVATATSLNGNTFTTGTYTLTGVAGKTLTFNKSITLEGTDATTMTFPSVSATIARTVASGAKALATGAIASAACTTAQTDTATGTLTTDVIAASFNGDPTAVTGYVPLTTGMLTIIVYPTADTFNAKVCNNSSSSITPGAITLNWRVTR